MLDALDQRGEPAAAVRPLEVSLKLSALGQALPRDGEKIALENAHAICERAQRVGAWVTVDAEDHTTTDSTLSIVRDLRTEFGWLGTVLQAYLRRTEADCEEFAASGARIRLCKGAYDEPASVAYRDREDVTASYLRCLRVLMAGDGYPMVASHDPEIIEAVPAMVREFGRGVDDFEYQMLYGIRDAEQRRLAADGNHVRVYVPFGTQWYGYFVRRLAERPANLTFFLQGAGRAQALVGRAERVVLVGDHPTAVTLAQADRQSQSVVGVGFEILGLAAAQQRPRERDVGARRHVEFDDLELRALALPVEERRPGIPVLVDAAQTPVRRRHVEHHDVRIMFRQHRIKITGVYRRRPNR